MMGDRSELFVRYALADRLSKTLPEIDAMTLEEFSGWQAYILALGKKKKNQQGA